MIRDNDMPMKMPLYGSTNVRMHYNIVINDVISGKKNGLPLIQFLSLTPLRGLHYTPGGPWLKVVEDVEKAFKKRCNGAGIHFGLERFDNVGLHSREDMD